MFKCGMCKNIVPPRVRSHKIITKRREREYKIELFSKPDDIIKYRYSKGWEIVEEKLVCLSCDEKASKSTI